MTTPNESDRHFHENLETLGRSTDTPDGVSGDVRARCLAQLRGEAARASVNHRAPRSRRLFPAMGLAASIVLVAGLIIPWHSVPKVQAAEILAALDQQLEGSSVIELNIDSVVIEEVTLSGHLQVAEKTVAGDVLVTVLEDPSKGPIRIDASLGLSGGGGWILVRELHIPDAEAQAILSFILPPGTETLLVLPEAVVKGNLGHGLQEPLEALSSDGVKEVIEAILDSASDVGATVTPQGDGTVLLSIPLEDQAAMAALVRTVVESAQATDGSVDGEVVSEEDLEEIEISLREDNDLQVLVGGTIRVVYDPNTGEVRSFSMDGIGDADGSISIAVHGGEIDPALLDAARVTGPNTRTLDLAALKGLIGNSILTTGN